MITLQLVRNDTEVIREYNIELPDEQRSLDKYTLPFITCALDSLVYLKRRRLAVHEPDD